MNPTVPDLELPAITGPDRPPPIVSSADALRWRIAKHAKSKPLVRLKPRGEPFMCSDEPVLKHNRPDLPVSREPTFPKK